MDLEWAAEATAFDEAYVSRLSSSSPEAVAKFSFFESGVGDAEAYALFRRRFPEMQVGLVEAGTSAERYVEDREWRTVVPRLELRDGRILTPLRVDAASVSGPRRLVPRVAWACVELARCREGVYDDKTLAALRASLDEKVTTTTTTTTTPDTPTDPTEEDQKVVEVARDADGERRVVVRRDVAPGELLFAEEAIAVPYDFSGFGSGGACFHCGRVGSDVVSCAFAARVPKCCGVAAFAFCSRDCERRRRPAHEKECAATKLLLLEEGPSSGGTVAPFKLVLATRAALLEEEDDDSEDSSGDTAATLKTHLADVDEAMRRDVEAAASRVAKALGRDGTFAGRVRDWTARVDVNAIALGDKACGFAPKMVAMCNHSCLETATHYATWDDAGGAARVVVRSVVDLRRGDEVSFCYLGESDLAEPTPTRRDLLRQTKHFLCRCPRCRDPDLDRRCLLLQDDDDSLDDDGLLLFQGEKKKETPHPPPGNDVLAEARRVASAAARLHGGRFAVAVAATKEALADVLAQCAGNESDAVAAYDDAEAHLQVCRPGSADLRRVREKRRLLLRGDDNEDEAAPPLMQTIVLEVKTWDPLTEAALLEDLAPRLRQLQPLEPTFLCRWDPAASIVPLAFGVNALALSCVVVEKTGATTKNRHKDDDDDALRIDTVELDLAERLADALPDEIQSVDVGAAS